MSRLCSYYLIKKKRICVENFRRFGECNTTDVLFHTQILWMWRTWYRLNEMLFYCLLCSARFIFDKWMIKYVIVVRNSKFNNHVIAGPCHSLGYLREILIILALAHRINHSGNRRHTSPLAAQRCNCFSVDKIMVSVVADFDEREKKLTHYAVTGGSTVIKIHGFASSGLSQ